METNTTHTSAPAGKNGTAPFPRPPIAPRTRLPWHLSRWWGTSLALAFPIAALTPLLLLMAMRTDSAHSRTTEAAVDAALLAFTLLSLQFILAARFRWIEGPFGLDRLVRLHRALGLLATALLLAHPLLLIPDFGTRLLTRLNTHWYFWLARIALATLLLHVAAALLRRGIPLQYQTWRRIHALFALAILTLGTLHSLAVGDDLASPRARLLWISVAAIGPVAFVYSRLLRPLLHRLPSSGRLFTVISVKAESPIVHTITLAQISRKNTTPFHHLPGQFQFIRFRRGNRWSPEHPFTIASAPSPSGELSLTIKSCGDFTSSLHLLRQNDLATIHGPFGRFSYTLHPDERDLVFIAGGVGITPFISMLRHMNHALDGRRVHLFFANRRHSDILFADELDKIERDNFPRLRVIHILSEPHPDWPGETGRLDADRILRYTRGHAGKVFYLCAPPPMTASLGRALKQKGIPRRNLRTDFFSI